MEKKRIVPVWVSVILVLLIATSVAFSVWSLATQEAGSDTAFFVLNILLDLCAFYYCVMGYSKSGAVFFKLYCWLNILLIALTLFFDAVNFTVSVLSAVLFLLPLLELMLYFVFAVVPDLGKKKSLTLVSILSGTIVVEDVVLTILTPALLMPCVGAIVVTAVFFIMVYAKYADKTARGTK